MIGGGLAGLRAAWRLDRRGVAVVVVEAQELTGGRTRCESADGFVFEPGGALLDASDAPLLRWIDEVGLRDELLPLRPVLSAQLARGRIHPIDPRGLRGIARIPGVRPHEALRLLRLPRLMSRYRDALDPATPERAADLDDRSLADFGRLYFGRSVMQRWMAPYATRASLGDEEEASRVQFLRRYAAHGESRPGLPRASLAELPRAASERLRVRCNMRATRVGPGADGRLRVKVRQGERKGGLDVDAVVLATPADEAAAIAKPLLSLAERDLFERVRTTPSLTLAVALRRPFAPHPQLVHFPHVEGTPLETALFEPGLEGGRAPAGRGLCELRATGAWSAAYYDAPEETVSKELVSAMATVHPGFPRAVQFSKLLRVPAAMPRFDVGRYREIARFERVQADQRRGGRRLYFAGDYLMDPSRSGALASADRAADAVAEDLGL